MCSCAGSLNWYLVPGTVSPTGTLNLPSPGTPRLQKYEYQKRPTDEYWYLQVAVILLEPAF